MTEIKDIHKEFIKVKETVLPPPKIMANKQVSAIPDCWDMNIQTEESLVMISDEQLKEKEEQIRQKIQEEFSLSLQESPNYSPKIEPMNVQIGVKKKARESIKNASSNLKQLVQKLNREQSIKIKESRNYEDQVEESKIQIDPKQKSQDDNFLYTGSIHTEDFSNDSTIEGNL